MHRLTEFNCVKPGMMSNNNNTPSREPETLTHSAQVEYGTLGDWMLVFPAKEIGIPSRQPANHWNIREQGNGWELWTTSPNEIWRGSPFIRIETPAWQSWLVGELYGISDPANTILSVLSGKVSPAFLNGHFHVLARDKITNEWHIWTNRFATLHAYRGLNGQRSSLGSFLPAVAAAAGCTQLDWPGITSFFAFGFFADDRSHYSDVRILRPATHYHYDEQGRLLREKRYWDWWYAPDVERTYDETVDEFADVLTSVMKNLMADGRIGIPISGGLDSRSTIAAIDTLSSSHDRVWAYSYGYGEGSIETDIAAQVAEKRALPIHVFEIKPYLFDRLEEVLNSIEGFLDVTQARQAAITPELRRCTDRLIAAHWGDVFLDDMGLSDSAPSSMTTDELVDYALAKIKKPSGWLLKELCRPQFSVTKSMSVMRDLFHSQLTALEHIAEPDFRMKAFKTDQWSARWTTASLRMFQAATFPRLPFYDIRISDFFATVPTAYVAGRRLQVDYLKRYAPDLAAVNWQAAGKNLFKVGRPDPLELPRRAVRKGLRKLSGRQTIERNWEIQFLGRNGHEGLGQWLLQSGLLLHEFVPQPIVAELVTAFIANPLAGKRGHTVSMLLTFSAWLELHSRAGLSR
jgi:asparagine synthase (glutamine-hydrolysing)